MLIFQAGLTIAEVGFEEEPEDDKTEPLRMEPFHLPLGMWMVGLLISLFCFLAEIISNWITKRKALRETLRHGGSRGGPSPSVRGSRQARVTFQQEVQHNTDVDRGH